MAINKRKAEAARKENRRKQRRLYEEARDREAELEAQAEALGGPDGGQDNGVVAAEDAEECVEIQSIKDDAKANVKEIVKTLKYWNNKRKEEFAELYGFSINVLNTILIDARKYDQIKMLTTGQIRDKSEYFEKFPRYRCEDTFVPGEDCTVVDQALKDSSPKALMLRKTNDAAQLRNTNFAQDKASDIDGDQHRDLVEKYQRRLPDHLHLPDGVHGRLEEEFYRNKRLDESILEKLRKDTRLSSDQIRKWYDERATLEEDIGFHGTANPVSDSHILLEKYWLVYGNDNEDDWKERFRHAHVSVDEGQNLVATWSSRGIGLVMTCFGVKTIGDALTEVVDNVIPKATNIQNYLGYDHWNSLENLFARNWRYDTPSFYDEVKKETGFSEEEIDDWVQMRSLMRPTPPYSKNIQLKKALVFWKKDIMPDRYLCEIADWAGISLDECRQEFDTVRVPDTEGQERYVISGNPCKLEPAIEQADGLEPNLVGQEAALVGLEPAPIDLEPALVDLEPAFVGQEPAPAAQEPAPVGQEPAPAAQEPAPAAQEPAFVGQEPVPAAQEPAPVAQEPAPAAQEPAPAAQEPAPVVAEPHPLDMLRHVRCDLPKCLQLPQRKDHVLARWYSMFRNRVPVEQHLRLQRNLKLEPREITKWFKERFELDQDRGIEIPSVPVPTNLMKLESAWLYLGEALDDEHKLAVVCEWADVPIEQAKEKVERWNGTGIGLVRTFEGVAPISEALEHYISKIIIRAEIGAPHPELWQEIEGIYTRTQDRAEFVEKVVELGLTESEANQWIDFRKRVTVDYDHNYQKKLTQLKIFWKNDIPDCYIKQIAKWLKVGEYRCRKALEVAREEAGIVPVPPIKRKEGANLILHTGRQAQ